ncbi:MAG: hypothetical protein BWY77_01305 [bacterium ADurb.Bin431]|nr:MAG: hypothetical protein BWY77_01305 [bacterium ADurb.Bin431]
MERYILAEMQVQIGASGQGDFSEFVYPQPAPAHLIALTEDEGIEGEAGMVDTQIEGDLVLRFEGKGRFFRNVIAGQAESRGDFFPGEEGGHLAFVAGDLGIRKGLIKGEGVAAAVVGSEFVVVIGSEDIGLEAPAVERGDVTEVAGELEADFGGAISFGLEGIDGGGEVRGADLLQQGREFDAAAVVEIAIEKPVAAFAGEIGG